MADTDLEHVRVRYKGASVLDVMNPHRDTYTEGVKAGDIIEVPAHEVAAWGDTPPPDWEIVRDIKATTESKATAGGK